MGRQPGAAPQNPPRLSDGRKETGYHQIGDRESRDFSLIRPGRYVTMIYDPLALSLPQVALIGYLGETDLFFRPSRGPVGKP